MLRRQIPSALLLSTLLAFVATTGVLGKDDAIVTLDAALPADPEPGNEITVGWTVETPGEDGQMAPFNAEAMFVRLISPEAETVEAMGRQGPPGHYVATVTVPAGGIRDVEFGLRGESCSGGTCQRSDILFAIDDSVIPVIEAGAPANAPGPGTFASGPAGATLPVAPASDLQPLGLAVLVLAAAAAVPGLVALRSRGRGLARGSSRS
jgi:hypothetical protein